MYLTECDGNQFQFYVSAIQTQRRIDKLCDLPKFQFYVSAIQTVYLNFATPIDYSAFQFYVSAIQTL